MCSLGNQPRVYSSSLSPRPRFIRDTLRVDRADLMRLPCVRTGTTYRSDIDGFRSIAILPVLLFHAGLSGFSGGYVGVDVFFVISGYLITGIIAREIDKDCFSIISFYDRRARRIMPALVAVILAVLAAAAWLYLPGDFESVPRSALA